ncbi:hypothetical protein A5893_10360 [Pedobacter psychrophilus]|uniref:Periplasmic protein n=1 Tax=Pedobacter psychrophilus TaxID=1826909 RepID=A0A179DEZ2_9SPHI|nr:hypothetical protein [Pedobacter psychrophilus]OAQ39069.1 hypothetical protein A5893_10360 [Pedobacter psychrophilus]
MKIQLLILLIFLTKLSVSQVKQAILKKEYISDNYSLYYSIDESKVLNGNYYVNDAKNALVLKGNYSNGLRNGLWLLFNNDGSLKMSFNSSSNKLIFLIPNFFSNIGYSFSEEKMKDFRLALPLFSFDLLFDLLSQNKAFKSLDRESAKELSLVASINENGKATFTINKNDNILIDNLEIENNKFFDLDWIPAFNSNRNTSIRLIFPLNITPDSDAERQRFRWNY